MTKRYDEPIDVGPQSDAAFPVVSFTWRGRAYRVDRLLGAWRETAEVWDRARARDREYHRLLVRPASLPPDGSVDDEGLLRREPGAVFDVYRDRVRGTWRLERIWD